MRPTGAAMPASAAESWLAATVPWWIPRALILGWVGAFAAAVAGDVQPCSPADPSICGPDQGFAWAVVLLFATPVLLWWQPLAGCAAGVAFAIVDVAFDDVRAANVAFGLHGVLCLTTAVWILDARRRQREIVDALGASRERLPAVAFTERWGPRVLACAALVCAGAGLLGVYAHVVNAEQQHLDRAIRADGRVLSVDEESSTITVESPSGRHVLAVLDATIYQKGSTVALLLDPADARWARLVAEPVDSTGWESAGLGCLALAGLLWWRELAARRGRRRLLAGEHPVLEVCARPDPKGDALVFPADPPPPGATLRLLAVLPLGWSSADPDDEDGPADDVMEDMPDAGEVAAIGRAWRGEGGDDDDFFIVGGDEAIALRQPKPERAALVGDLVEGGWVAMVTDDELLLPRAPLHLEHRPLGVRWRRVADALLARHDIDQIDQDVDTDGPPGRPVQATPAIETPLPAVLLPPRSRRLTGLVMLLGLVAAPVALAAGFSQDLFEHVVLIGFGASFTYGGLMRLSHRLVLTRRGLTLTNGIRTVDVPWERFHGARVDREHLYLAFEPDDVVQVGPFEATGAPRQQQRRHLEQVAALMMTLRVRALAAGSAGRPVRRGATRPVLLGMCVYALLVIAALWWHPPHG